VIEDFVKATGWHPRHILPVAGALVYSQYNFLVKLIMKRIARAVGAGTDTSRDYEYTDWVSLDHFVQEFAHEFSPSAS
jgi:menaquinone-dependent protoporphyrinogen oxidase